MRGEQAHPSSSYETVRNEANVTRIFSEPWSGL
jgi:hypothetical protein